MHAQTDQDGSATIRGHESSDCEYHKEFQTEHMKPIFQLRIFWVISGLRREVDENHALLGYYAATSGNSLPTFRDYLVPKRQYEIATNRRVIIQKSAVQFNLYIFEQQTGRQQILHRIMASIPSL
jgi:hypothetical protein